MDGVFCPGGSLGNIMAISMARHRKWPECKKKGNSVIPSPVRIFTSETVSITTTLCMLNYSAIWLSTHRGDLINSFRLSTGTCSNKLSFPRRYHFRNLRFVLLTLTCGSWRLFVGPILPWCRDIVYSPKDYPAGREYHNHRHIIIMICLWSQLNISTLTSIEFWNLRPRCIPEVDLDWFSVLSVELGWDGISYLTPTQQKGLRISLRWT